MDLLYDGNVEAFALVTSDSDFTSLAHRLRESGKAVYVLGENKAPESLRNACDKFIDLAVVTDRQDDGEDADEDADDETAEVDTPSINLQSALTRAVNAVSDDDGWALLPALGNQLIRTHPSFDARNFAGPGARLSTLVAAQPYLEASGDGNALRVRLKGHRPTAQKPAVQRTTAQKTAVQKPTVQKPTVQKTTGRKRAAQTPEVAEATEQPAPQKRATQKKAAARKS